ncbi:MAG: alpha/beta fold hydrolase [Halieaceae bacterium]
MKPYSYLPLMLLALSLLPLSSHAELSDPVPDPDFPPTVIELTILSDEQRLPGMIYLANGPGPHPTVLLLHGFPGNEKNLDIAQDLRRHGFNVLFFHFRGSWGADGSYRVTNLPADVAAALAYLRQADNSQRLRVDTGKLSLLGHSMGGFTALAAGSRDKNLSCIGAMSPANMGSIKLGIGTEDSNSLRIMHYADSLYMLKDYGSRAMLEELRTASLDELDTRAFGPGLAGKSVLLVVGDKDQVTPAATAMLPVAEQYSKIPGLKLEHHVISGDHSFSWSRLALTELVRDWMLRDCR